MDTLDKQQRSKLMSKIHSKNTVPEMTLRKALFAKGLRYRINDKKLLGKPDIVFPKYKTAIFVHGCFWHNHKGCKRAHLPKSNIEYWENKIRTNEDRDNKNREFLQKNGWNVIVVWECEIKSAQQLEDMTNKIIDKLKLQSTNTVRIKIYEEIESAIMMVAEDEIPYSLSK